MTRQNPYTQRAIERAIRAALAAGLTVTAVLPDGTVLTEARDNRPAPVPEPLTGKPKLRDAREKLGVH
ncbi:hypothetical protein SAMN05216337_1001235 [Bradyrhizobium brasilense]|uniref:Uncharacterized protein n=1 Tax=Bradyrhizobium brasilense TaxID=1419277 RepID=A0A1G6ITF8_9BRAD|nr:hypothetical protein [Bradyrhizobium brasilense]SDC09325.1 hypothetical protein SAMN05216337_1001235 [Bradyrhizobium brasilense]